MDARTQRIVGVEALIRWSHPERGMIPPGEFIPVAESTGLIGLIGEWVLREACHQAMRWERAGLPPITVAVNLSAVPFRRGRLDELVASALRESGLPAQRLELELTESILLPDNLPLADTLTRFKALGVRISIDDFGTGYSNLLYLKRFSIDKKKLDQSFVRNISLSPDDMAIVQSIVLLARRMKIATIAEGVETQRQLDYLRMVHCEEIQGYFTGRPMAADAVAQRLAVPLMSESLPL